MLLNNSKLQLALVLLAATLAISPVQADEDHEEDEHGGGYRIKPLQPAHENAKFQQECASCHTAYAPGLLPAESWRRVMGGLDKHFGTDASMDEQDRREITNYLVINSANRWNAPSSPLRITETPWFKRKHDAHEVSPSVWKNPKVKSPANCAACHPRADKGNFNEHEIKIPK